MRGIKGISPLLSYVFAILLAVIVIAGISLLVYNFYKNLVQDEIKRELTQSMAETSAKITDIYTISKASKSSPANATAILLASEQLNLPSRVASHSYTISLVSSNQITTLMSNITVNGQNISVIKNPQTAKIIAQSTEDPIVQMEYDIPNIDVDIQGKTLNPANATLRYYRYNPNGTVIDTILLGDYTLLGQVTALS